MTFWDDRFSGTGYHYGQAPNAFLAEQAQEFASGSSILVPGDGEGRNGVWLASQGHTVHSVDISQVGLDKAAALAALSGVTLHTELADLATWQPAPHSVDAVALIYVHLPPAIRRDAHRRLAGALRPGGLLVLEAFHPRQLDGYHSGGPKSADMLYTLDALRADFGELLQEVLVFEGEIELDEGPGHQGPAFVTRWVGRASAPR